MEQKRFPLTATSYGFGGTFTDDFSTVYFTPLNKRKKVNGGLGRLWSDNNACYHVKHNLHGRP